MWTTYPDFSLSFRETQHSSLIPIKYIANLAYNPLPMFSRINHFQLKRGRQIDNSMKCDGLVIEQHQLLFSLWHRFAGCTEVRLTLLISFVLLCFMTVPSVLRVLHSCAAQLPGCHLLNQTLYVNGATALRGFARRDRKLNCENETA